MEMEIISAEIEEKPQDISEFYPKYLKNRCYLPKLWNTCHINPPYQPAHSAGTFFLHFV